MTNIIDQAYALYMPQIRSEIEQLCEFVQAHYGFTPKSAPYNILEIGTKYGGTFYLWSSMNQSSGLNISIDMNDGGLHGGISEEEMDKRDLWFSERFDNVKFIRGDSHSVETVCKLQETIEPAFGMMMLDSMYDPDDLLQKIRKIDFLFIDGDHTYEGVEQDFYKYLSFVKPGGIIAFHDIVDSQRHRDRDVYVAKFWNEIKGNYTHHEIVAGEDWGGIGILQV